MNGAVDNRNLRAKEFVLNELKKAKKSINSKNQKFDKELKILKALIPIPANGFRGIVLTSIVGMYLDKNFNPKINFYDCNPRSIFEKGIYYALQDSKIPCGKSDPLNVAKNIQQIDLAWAKGKRPETAAIAAVEYINLLVASKNSKRYEDLVSLFFGELYKYGEFINSQNVSITPESIAIAPALMATKLGAFVIECAEGGATTQYVVGLLIHYLRKNDTTYKSVEGYQESVFGTNTTSKKPADVWELNEGSELGNLYEITVKTIDKKRIEDCVENLYKLNLQNLPVTFICNLPFDIATLENVENNSLTRKGVAIQFIDIKSYILFGYISLSNGLRKEYLKELQKFVFDTNRAPKTKQYWAKNFT